MTLILWLMITPGNWQVHTEVFKSEDECHQAEHVLMDATNIKKVREIIAVREIYEHGGGLGFFWISCR